MSADGQIKSFIDRIMRLKEEEDTIKSDIRDVYAEAKAMGFDKTVMGKVVAYLRKVDKAGATEVEEAEMIFDTYLDAYRRASGTKIANAHTHAGEAFDAETGEILDDQVDAKLVATVATGMQTEAGRAALVAAVDIMIEQVEAEEGIQANPEEEGAHGSRDEAVPAVDAGSRPVVGRSTTATSEKMDVTGGESAATNPEMDRATEGSFETGSEAAEKGRKAIPAGPEGVDLNHAGAGESPATEIAPAPQGEAEAPSAERASELGMVELHLKYKPNCLRPEACGSSYIDRHCHSCMKAAAITEDA